MNKLITLKNKIKQHPKGLFVLFYTEMQELFGRSGIAAILIFYLTKTLRFSDSERFIIYSSFISLTFLTPIIGGLLVDKFLGNFQAIILGGSIMLLGNLLLVFPKPFMVCLWPGYYRHR